jgi:integrase
VAVPTRALAAFHCYVHYGLHVTEEEQGEDLALADRTNLRSRPQSLPAAVGSRQRSRRHPLHDLRHTHKTWMIEDDVPEVAQCRRLEHKLGGIRGVYSHVTQPMIDALLAGMQDRWEATNTPVRAVTSTDLQ